MRGLMKASWLHASVRPDMQRVLCWALVVSLWAVTRPYGGIVHDARLYSVRALEVLAPGRYAGDLYLHYGGHSQFDTISSGYAFAISSLGLSSASMLLVLFGQTLWLGGLVFLARGLVRDPRHALLAVALAIALPGGYGAQNSFVYGEPFLTPRLY